MKVYVLLIGLLFCLPVFAKRVVMVGEVMDLHDKIVAGKPFTFTNPAGTYQKIFEVKTQADKYECLYYKVPLNKESKGELFSFSATKHCQLAQVIKEGEKEEGLLELRIFDIDLENKMSFKVQIKTAKSESSKTYFLPFISKSRSYWRGIFPTYKKTQKGTSFVSFKEGEVCHQGCGDLRDQCNRCPDEQWTLSLTLKCASQVSGVCGDSLCGERGQNACVRMTALQQNLSCEEIKKFVYCSYGREVECQSDGRVTCR